jgi:hypothetical protein
MFNTLFQASLDSRQHLIPQESSFAFLFQCQHQARPQVARLVGIAE